MRAKRIKFDPDLARALGAAIVEDYAAARVRQEDYRCGSSFVDMVDTLKEAVTSGGGRSINLVLLHPADARVLARACAYVSQRRDQQGVQARRRLHKVCDHFRMSVVEVVGMILVTEQAAA